VIKDNTSKDQTTMTATATETSFPTVRENIAGIPVREIAKRFGTPTYVYDANVIAQKVNDLKQFDVIRYAQKACSNIAILDRLRKLGVTVDAVSAGEIMRALKAGYQPHSKPHQIVYTADIFDRAALDLICQHRLHVNIGSPDMIDQLGEVLPGSDITLRINPGFGHGHSRKTNTGGSGSKHGIWHEQVDQCLLRADRHGLTVTGLHMHIGSGTDLEHLATVCGALEKTARSIGRTITTISAGGGLPVPYRVGQSYVDIDQYYKLWDNTRQKLQNEFGHAIQLEIEPGRYLVAESGFLVAEIRAIKTMGENTYYLVDAGFNDLARPILYGAHHPISIASRDGRTLSSNHQVVIGGPLCESGDIFTQDEGGYVTSRELPAAQVGDYLVLEVAGAYGFVMASNYNSKFRAPEVLIENGKPIEIRRRETFEDLIAAESLGLN
jgi:diaminopimelate decarboxylase